MYRSNEGEIPIDKPSGFASSLALVGHALGLDRTCGTEWPLEIQCFERSFPDC